MTEKLCNFLQFNSVAGTLMKKSLSGSVGRSARNLFADVRLVQYLLNCVPMRRGGPTRELVVDGLCGPRTVRAIFRFQRSLRGSAAVRIDPNRRIFRALLAYDLYPSQPLPPFCDNP